MLILVFLSLVTAYIKTSGVCNSLGDGSYEGNKQGWRRNRSVANVGTWSLADGPIKVVGSILGLLCHLGNTSNFKKEGGTLTY